MKVSVVVCTRNGDEFLGRQLNSLLAQTRLPDEVIVSDDESSDASVAIAEAFVAVAKARGIHVEVHRNVPALGVSANFEQTCRRATGDVIFLADQDDAWHAGKVARLIEVLDTRGLMLVATDARIIDSHDLVNGETLFGRLHLNVHERAQLVLGDLRHVILYRTAFTGATTAFRRELLNYALPFPAGVVHDEWLAHVAWLVGDAALLEECWMDYRLHSRNTIGLDPPPLDAAGNTAGGRLKAHLERIVSRTGPLVTRFAEIHPACLDKSRLQLRKRQQALALARSGYSQALCSRACAVYANWRQGLYSVEERPARTAVLDLFRHTGGANPS